MEKILEYQSFRKLDAKIKLKLIKQASQDEKWRKDNPQGTYRFLEQDFIQFQVFQGKHKLSLKTYRHYKSKDMSSAIGIVFMFHGLNSYMDHGAHIAHALAQVGFITVGLDHRGFGRSPGERAYVESLQSHIYDAITFTKKVLPLHPNLPAFALGLSMGGLTSYYLTLRYKNIFKGAILMAPAIKNIVNQKLVGLINGMGSIFFKKMRIPFTPPKGQATRNPKITEDVYSDPFAYKDKPCLKTIQMLTTSMKQTPKTFHEYQSPFMIVQGGLDKLVHPDGAFELYDNCKSKDKTILFYEQMWHDIWHEEQIYEIIEKVKVWLLQRVPKNNIEQEKVEVIDQKTFVTHQGNTNITTVIETTTEIKTHQEFQELREEINDKVEETTPFNQFQGGFTG